MAVQKNNTVLVVGELNVDIIMNGIRQFPSIGKEVLADQMTLTLGSSAAIFASNLSTLGSNVLFTGCLGNDRFGDLIISSFNARGVNTKYIKRSDSYQTGATVVLNVDEDRAMITHPGAMQFLELSDVKDDALHAASHLHVSSVFLQPGLYPELITLFKKAKKAGLTTSLDPQGDPAGRWDLPLQQLLPHVDIFLPNIAELYALTKTSVLKDGLDALRGFANTVVVKNASEGAYLWENDQLIRHAGFLNKNVVDSIGAGDSFDAGFIHQFINKKTKAECLEFGALTGAINTTRPGGTTAFESMELVRAIASASFNYTF